ncbi:MAG: hypothetical protein GKR89_22810 [Candidatus Latescibacteria bacterium]|nr:hypothetical protein [Candidatus Latescibacterota bacterium]
MPSINAQDLSAALPDLTTPLTLAALHHPVDIYRDPWGIPHIRAQDEHDLFFAQGFTTAQDRLFHMDFDRHQALGRWAEWAGPQGLDRDRLLRAAGMGRTAQLDYQCASPQARAMVDAYSAGVNAFIDTTRTLPIEYTLLGQQPEPWEPWHCPTVYKMRNSLLGTFEPKLFRTRLLQQLGPQTVATLFKGYPPGHLLTVPPGVEYSGPQLDALAQLGLLADQANWLDEVDMGSNAWSIAGHLTQSGLPLMGGDSHRGLDTPNVYYQVHLSCPQFSVIGHSVPGMPGALHFCHNQYVGWGMTYGSADTQDLFVERFRDTEQGRQYAFKDQWRTAEVATEILRVRDEKSVHTMQTTRTHHGPVIAGDPASGWGVAIADPGLLQGTPWIDATRDAMQARSVAQLDQALAQWTDRVNNYAVVDVDGRFGYLHAGKIPIRSEANGWCAVPGWSGEHEWQGYIPHAELPRALDPQAGYAITCNQRVAGHDYPYYVGLYFTPEYRARAIQHHILALAPGQATIANMERIHAERTSLPARDFVQHLLRLPVAHGAAPQALDYLRAWDYKMDRDRVAPTLYAQTKLALVRRLTEHHFGPLASEVLSGAAGTDPHVRLLIQEIFLGLNNDDGALLPPDTTWPDMLTQAMTQALDQLADSLGPDMHLWTWGRLHRTQPRHPLAAVFPETAARLNPPSLPIHGDGDTPLAGSYGIERPFVATGLSVNRYIHDPSNWNNSRWIVPLGASGHPASPHYADQADTWARVGYIPQLWDWDEIAARAETTQHLEPTS